jgi:diguanylate cyclase (GGDEF)-like protein
VDEAEGREAFGGIAQISGDRVRDDGETLQHLQEQTRKQSLLLDTMRALTSTLVLEDVLALAARSAAEVMGVFSADINVYSPVENTMTEVAYWALEITPEDEAYSGSTISLDERPDYYAFVHDPVLVERQLDDPGFPPQEREIADQWGEMSALIVPLVYGERFIGLMGCMEKRWVRRFTAEDKELFQLLSVPAALAIHNAEMFQREEMRNRRLVNLLSAAQHVAAALSRDEVARRVCEEAPRLFPTRSCAADVFFLTEHGAAAPACATPRGRTEPATAPDPLAAAALGSAGPARSDGGEAHARLVVPMLSRDQPVGYVELTDPRMVAFTDDEVEILGILVTQAETALENSRLYGEIERQAISDDLTGLANQRYFHERLRQETSRARRLGTSFSLLMLDLDDFKLVNDRLGHLAGDAVLRAFAGVLGRQLREGVDLAARYGGDEFVVILPDVGERTAADGACGEAALVIAERVRSSLEHGKVTADERLVDLTLSGGVATFPDDAADEEELVRAADKALYLAKRLGKNRVEAFG